MKVSGVASREASFWARVQFSACARDTVSRYFKVLRDDCSKKARAQLSEKARAQHSEKARAQLSEKARAQHSARERDSSMTSRAVLNSDLDLAWF